MTSSPTRRTRSPAARALNCHAAARPAPVAQLDRASVYGTEGQRFESSRARSTESLAKAGLSSFPGSSSVLVASAIVPTGVFGGVVAVQQAAVLVLGVARRVAVALIDHLH